MIVWGGIKISATFFGLILGLRIKAVRVLLTVRHLEVGKMRSTRSLALACFECSGGRRASTAQHRGRGGAGLPLALGGRASSVSVGLPSCPAAPSLVLDQRLHLVDQLARDPQDLLRVVALRHF